MKNDTASLDRMAEALCLDYDRRADLCRRPDTPRRTAMECEYLNTVMREAAQEIAGEDWEVYLREIGSRTGYAFSALEISESTYKLRKKEVKDNILRRLHLTAPSKEAPDGEKNFPSRP